MSWPKTVLDDEEAMAELLVRRSGNETPRVRAPCCGRVVSAAVLVDARGTAIPHEWCCDACRSRLVRSGDWKRSDMARELGAPVAEVKVMRAKEIVRERARNTPGPFDPLAEFDRAMGEL